MPAMSPEFQQTYMRVAEAMATKSKDPSTQVGAVLVRPNMTVASLGFNGFPRRMFDDPDLLSNPARREEKLMCMVHAESNALRNSTDGNTEGYHMVVTRHPCAPCALEISSSGITDVWYRVNREFETRWADSLANAKLIFEKNGISLNIVEVTI